MSVDKNAKRQKVKYRIRKKINGTESLPRLTVFKSNKSIYCQIINDLEGKTMVAASSVEGKTKGTKTEQATAVGKMIAEKAISNKIENVVFDRNGYLYHGRVKAVAEAARAAGLKF